MKRLPVLLLTLTLAAAACRSTTSPGAELAEARERWAAQRLTSYEMTVHFLCGECEPEAGFPVRVTVRNGAAESFVYVASGASVPEARRVGFPATVEGLFARIEEAQRQGVHSLRVTYHPTVGYPTSIDIDHSTQAVDDEVGYVVSDFRAL